MAFLEFRPEQDFVLLAVALFLPLAGYAVQLFVGRHLPRKGDWLLTGGMFVTMSITVLMFCKALRAVYQGEPFVHQSSEHGLAFHWLYSSGAVGAGAAQAANVVAGFLYDPLGAAMLMVVGVVSFCVHLFSIGYMHGDRRYHLFFANISLFTFAMLGLVLADNILFLFIFWELMGLMSYLLIGHFSHDPGNSFFHRWATWACKKAFLTTRVGDVCLFVGIMIFYSHFETFRFTGMWEAARETVAANGGEFPAWMTWAGLLVFGGTVGKSAQFPLHIWLPDAMAGPTPVSAMIHAATMVAAGVFLLGRTYPLMSPDVLTFVTVVGAFTALFAATIGTTAWDLKAVLAYSTISQLGFMVAAVGLGGVVAGMFHMVTHAFFKACLFLSAGSVIHGCHHEQDMRRMGGIRRHMPVTFWCMLLSTMAIAGLPFFSGFYSKDMILKFGHLKVMDLGPTFGWDLFALGALALAAVLTAFYMFRLIFLTFYGEYRGVVLADHDDHPAAHGDHEHGHGHGHHEEEDDGIAHGHGGALPHESPWPMRIALIVLTALGVLGGHLWLLDSHFYAFWHASPWFERFASFDSMYGETVGAWLHQRFPHDEHLSHVAHGRAVMSSMVIAPLGIFLAWFLYVKRRDLPGRIAGALGEVYTTVVNKYYVDEMIDAVFIRTSLVLARVQRAFDERVIDGFVNLVGRTGRGLGSLSGTFDRVVIDGLVNAVAMGTQSFGSVVRLLQTGRVQQYVAFAVAGGLGAAAWLILS